MTIEFKERIRGTVRKRQWRGSRKAAIEAAIEWLGAEYRRYAKGWVYYAHESGEDIVLTEDELAVAGAAILAGAKDWYSLWCAEHGTPLRQQPMNWVG